MSVGTIFGFVVIVGFAVWWIALKLGPKATETPSQRSSFYQSRNLRGGGGSNRG